MTGQPIVLAPGEGKQLANVLFLTRTEDTPRFNLAIIDLGRGHGVDEHVHDVEDDAFYILDGDLTFTVDGREIAAPAGTFVLVTPGLRHSFVNRGDRPVRMLNIHSPAGFDHRIEGRLTQP
jgi:mannose-6-phosphate isomerase-like protein (cupin superfamily)